MSFSLFLFPVFFFFFFFIRSAEPSDASCRGGQQESQQVNCRQTVLISQLPNDSHSKSVNN